MNLLKLTTCDGVGGLTDMKIANNTKIARERFEMSMTASLALACPIFTLWNSVHTNFCNQFNPSKGFESHPK